MHAMCKDGLKIQMRCFTSAYHSFVPGTPKSFLFALNMMYHRLLSPYAILLCRIALLLIPRSDCVLRSVL